MGNSKDTYTISIRKKVWQKAKTLKGHDDDIWRRDKNGKLLNWQDYNDKDSEYGWTIQPKDAADSSVDNLEVIALS